MSSIVEIVKDHIANVTAPVAATIRKLKNTPWEDDFASDTPILVRAPEGRIFPMRIKELTLNAKGSLAIRTEYEWYLPIEYENVTWVRGWELTPDKYRLLMRDGDQ